MHTKDGEETIAEIDGEITCSGATAILHYKEYHGFLTLIDLVKGFRKKIILPKQELQANDSWWLAGQELVRFGTEAPSREMELYKLVDRSERELEAMSCFLQMIPNDIVSYTTLVHSRTSRFILLMGTKGFSVIDTILKKLIIHRENLKSEFERHHFEFSPDQKYLAVASKLKRKSQLFILNSGEHVDLTPLKLLPSAQVFTFSQDSSVIYINDIAYSRIVSFFTTTISNLGIQELPPSTTVASFWQSPSSLDLNTIVHFHTPPLSIPQSYLHTTFKTETQLPYYKPLGLLSSVGTSLKPPSLDLIYPRYVTDHSIINFRLHQEISKNEDSVDIWQSVVMKGLVTKMHLRVKGRIMDLQECWGDAQDGLWIDGEDQMAFSEEGREELRKKALEFLCEDREGFEREYELFRTTGSLDFSLGSDFSLWFLPLLKKVITKEEYTHHPQLYKLLIEQKFETIIPFLKEFLNYSLVSCAILFLYIFLFPHVKILQIASMIVLGARLALDSKALVKKQKDPINLCLNNKRIIFDLFFLLMLLVGNRAVNTSENGISTYLLISCLLDLVLECLLIHSFTSSTRGYGFKRIVKYIRERQMITFDLVSHYFTILVLFYKAFSSLVPEEPEETTYESKFFSRLTDFAFVPRWVRLLFLTSSLVQSFLIITSKLLDKVFMNVHSLIFEICIYTDRHFVPKKIAPNTAPKGTITYSQRRAGTRDRRTDLN